MTADIRWLVNASEAGQAAKHSNPVPNKNRQRLQAGRLWQVLSVDLVGPLTPTPRKNITILVLSDHFTRWRNALPVSNGSAETMSETLGSGSSATWECQNAYTPTRGAVRIKTDG